jgi:hypothetical protein
MLIDWIIIGCVTNLIYIYLFKKRIENKIKEEIGKIGKIPGMEIGEVQVNISHTTYFGMIMDIILFPIIWLIIFFFFLDKLYNKYDN